MYKIITIGRQHGSGGREVGKRAAERLGLPFYDKEAIIKRASKESSISIDLFDSTDTSGIGSLLYRLSEALAEDVRRDISLDDKIYIAQRNAILNIAKEGPCVIVGRGACEVLKDTFPVLRTLIYADMETRIKRVIEQYGEPRAGAEKRIRQIDKKRRTYYQYYEKREPLLPEHFDLCINSGKLGIDKTVSLICDAYNE